MKCEVVKVVKAAGYLVNRQDCLSFPFYDVLRKKERKRKEIITFMIVFKER
jgi:hypothetical protein